MWWGWGAYDVSCCWVGVEYPNFLQLLGEGGGLGACSLRKFLRCSEVYSEAI